jgi:hypothetical protein
VIDRGYKITNRWILNICTYTRTFVITTKPNSLCLPSEHYLHYWLSSRYPDLGIFEWPLLQIAACEKQQPACNIYPNDPDITTFCSR